MGRVAWFQLRAETVYSRIMEPISFGRALYYPHIFPQDRRWLRTAVLYHDGLARIVPRNFMRNARGGRSAAILASLTSTCRRHEVDPQLYLTPLLINLPAMQVRRSRAMARAERLLFDGAAPIDNNVSEREMKRVVLNRKNSFFVSSRPQPWDVWAAVALSIKGAFHLDGAAAGGPVGAC
jgi:hypothetical protein